MVAIQVEQEKKAEVSLDENDLGKEADSYVNENYIGKEPTPTKDEEAAEKPKEKIPGTPKETKHCISLGGVLCIVAIVICFFMAMAAMTAGVAVMYSGQQCEDKWTAVGQRCVRSFIGHLGTFEYARDFCEQESARLYNYNEDKSLELIGILENGKEFYWAERFGKPICTMFNVTTKVCPKLNRVFCIRKTLEESRKCSCRKGQN
ncbi:ORF31 [Ranid herpesvirus 2]|uniref:ORF31 n=1 Tax=Ranid herpesvirus 2 TaxID=389214 RepID=Q14W75_9VIRU|nr:ORF31 [Ranid herpesvirus 2]ABG25689.1 ORF31 [Ranid herpesvirus 2]